LTRPAALLGSFRLSTSLAREIAMKFKLKMRIPVSIILTFCLLALPATTWAKPGEKNYRRGLDYEHAQQWEKAAQEFTLALAQNPSDVEYQLHFRRASFNASQSFMQQGRSLAEQRDYVGAYNAFRQAYGYDQVNELAVSEMQRMLRLQAVKDGTSPAAANGNGNGNGDGSGDGSGGTPRAGELQDGAVTPASAPGPGQQEVTTGRTEQLRVISYTGDLKSFIRSLAEQLNLNVVFDRQSFAQSRTIELNLREVTTAQALDYVFLQEGLFFQKLSRRTILVADQNRRPQYQQLVLRTFYLSNMKPTDARQLVTQAIPASVGRPSTIVVPDDATNSLTVRDTAENVRLIGELLQSIDKDRAEVVMDVNIFEVTRTDLLQLGNQIGTPGANGTFNLGGSPGFSLLSAAGTVTPGSPGVNLTPIVGAVPTAAAAALVIPASVFTAFQSKGNTKLIASTQVHAFNGEESSARIGQRVPVQTAQAYPFGIQTGQPQNGQVFPSGGFPVINYEPTGLTLKFTPQVFPNFDVQVKMSIESKDVLGASTLTPTFTERTITGTARVQNNRTMMLASVSSDIESDGRAGLPLLGLIPVLGRLFTSPTKDNRRIDIVISVTPRVLRAPAVTPRDEEMRPSGTLQSPTTGSLEAMVREADHEDAIAAARRVPRNSNVQLPDSDPIIVGNPNANTGVAQANPNTQQQTPAQQNGSAVAQAATPKPQAPAEELPSYVPAPKSMISDKSAAELAAVNTGSAGTANAVLTSLPKPVDASINTLSSDRTASLSFGANDQVLKVGEKRRVAIQLNSQIPIGLAVLALKFDPKVVKVRTVVAGTMLGSQTDNAPVFTQSVDPAGTCLVSISALNSKTPMKGSGPLVFLEIEAIAEGDAGFVFDKNMVHLVATDARDVVLDLRQGNANVKQ
jgi:general secretion pathway protein D